MRLTVQSSEFILASKTQEADRLGQPYTPLPESRSGYLLMTYRSAAQNTRGADAVCASLTLC